MYRATSCVTHADPNVPATTTKSPYDGASSDRSSRCRMRFMVVVRG
jgi:hypothetical protein